MYIKDELKTAVLTGKTAIPPKATQQDDRRKALTHDRLADDS